MNTAIKKTWHRIVTCLYGSSLKSKGNFTGLQNFVLEPLEPRVLLSAGLPLTAVDYPPQNSYNRYEVVCEADILIDINHINQNIFIPEDGYDSQDIQTSTNGQTLFTIHEDINDIAIESYSNDNTLSCYTAEVTRQEIVFIDSNAPDYQRLIGNILASNNDTRNIEVIVLDSNLNGIEQISEVLAEYEDVDAVHILSHATSGELKLGSTSLSLNNLGEYKEQIQTWSRALSADADLLFYGCDLAAGEDGRTLLETIGNITGADVAASTDKTGNTLLGGDWILEYKIGRLETAVALNVTTQAQWQGLLATVSTTTTNDVLDGDTLSIAALIADPGTDGEISLREAIIAANNTAGADVISVPAGTYQLSITGTGENSAATGDLDIDDDVTIVGADASTTIIDANAIDRVFHAISGVIEIQNITITDGAVTNNGGAGMRIESAADVTLSDCIVSDNHETSGNEGGGGFYNAGSLTLSNSLITGNSANDDGGGVINFGTFVATNSLIDNNNAIQNNKTGGGIANQIAGDITLTNVTISGNAADTGGGIYHNAAAATLQNVTVTANSGTDYIGGVSAGGMTIRNTIIAGNTSGGSAPDIAGTFNSLGNNIIGDTAGGADGFDVSDRLDVDPLLNALADNGGPTMTHSLHSSSTAIDQGSATGAPSDDQRGYTRDASPDIGAFEYNPVITGTNFGFELPGTVKQFDWENVPGWSSDSVASDSGVEDWDVPEGSWRAYLWNLDPSVWQLTDHVIIAGQTYELKVDAKITGTSGELMMRLYYDDGGTRTEIDSATYSLSTDTWGEFTLTFDSDDVLAAVGHNLGIEFENTDGSEGWIGLDDVQLSFTASSDLTLWMATEQDVSGSGTPGITDWTSGTVIELGDPNFDLEPGTTNGTFSAAIDFDAMVSDGNASVSSLHYVTQDVLVGSSPSFQLLAGDVIVTFAQTETVGGFTANSDNVLVFRPTTLGDFSAGDWYRLLENPIGQGIGSLTLIEQDTLIGDYTVTAGHFLMTASGVRDIRYVEVTGTGLGTTSTTHSVLIHAADIDLGAVNNGIDALELVEEDIILGGTTLTAGQIIFGLESTDSSVGSSSPIEVTDQDFAVLTVTQTDLGGTGLTQATAALLLEGADINLDTTAERNAALTLCSVEGNLSPVITSDGGGDTAAVNVAENRTGVTTVTATDGDGDTPTFSITGGADAALFSIDTNTGVLTFNAAPDYENPGDSNTDNDYVVEVTADDGNGGTDSQTITVTVTDVNDNAPTQVNNTGSTVAEGGTDTISNTELRYDDAEQPATSVIYTVTGGLANGQLELTTNPGLAITSFTQDDIDNNRVVYVHDDSETTSDSFTFNVADGDGLADLIDDFEIYATGNVGSVANPPWNTTEGSFYADISAEGGGNQYVSTYGSGDWRDLSITMPLEIDAVGTLSFDVYVDAETGLDNAFGLVASETLIGGEISFYDDYGPYVRVTTDDGGDSNNVVALDARDGDVFVDNIAYLNIGQWYNIKLVIDTAGGDSGNGGFDVYVDDGLVYSSSDFRMAYRTPLDTFMLMAGIDANQDNVRVDNIEISEQPNTLTGQSFAITITPVNDNPPVITSDGGGATANVNAAENQTSVTTVTATDADGTSPTFSITGGADMALFSIDTNTGVLTFNAAPDYENPGDADINNTYIVEVTASDGTNTDIQTITVTVTNENDNDPVITSDGGGATAAVNAAENQTSVTTVTATDADGTSPSFSITGGADMALFSIDTNTGVLTFDAAPDYENPGDADINNTYIVEVTA